MNTNIITSWDMEDISLVTPPQTGGAGNKGGSTPDTPPTYWPGEAPPPPPSQDPRQGQEDENTIVIDDFDNLSEEQKQSIRDAIESTKGIDKHLQKDTAPDATNTEESLEEQRKRIEEIKKEAKEVHESKSKGRSTTNTVVPTNEELMVRVGNYDWKRALREFFKPWTAKASITTYAIPNRRDQITFPSAPPILRPGEIQKGSSKKLQIIATVDTSGSVDNDMLASFFAEIRAIFTKNIMDSNNIEVRIIVWTGEVTNDILLTNLNFQSFFKTIKREASGDTLFSVIKPHIISKRYTPVAIVHFTDGDMYVTRDMFFDKNGCKNIAVIPRGFTSNIEKCKTVFDRVIPMKVFSKK